jgi:hypothetical protein
MRRKKRVLPLVLAALFLLAFSVPPAVQAAQPPQPQEWELINPMGEIEKTAVNPAPRIKNLDGKTVVLRWNGKNNGDIALDRLAVLLGKKYPAAKIVKSYALDASINTITGNDEQSMRVTNFIKGLKPASVIAFQAD